MIRWQGTCAPDLIALWYGHQRHRACAVGSRQCPCGEDSVLPHTVQLRGTTFPFVILLPLKYSVDLMTPIGKH